MSLAEVSLQHNAMSLLLFNDDHAKMVRQLLDLSDWPGDPAFRGLVKAAYDYIDTYDRPPQADSYDLIKSLPITEDEQKAIEGVVQLLDFKTVNNVDYVLDKIKKFKKQSNLKQRLEKAYELIDFPDRFDEIETILHDALKEKDLTFDGGSTLADAIERRMNMNTLHKDEDRLHTGIGPLDIRGIMPSRKKMFLFIARQKDGKTWFLIKMGKQALKEGKKTVHVTLELSQEETEDRYLQAIGGLATDEMFKHQQLVEINTNQNGLSLINYTDVKMIDDHGALGDISRMFAGSAFLEDNLRIKEFPTKKLTLEGLEAYLDGLENRENFIPDVLILDYPDIMKVKGKDRRLELGDLYAELRGIAVERNLILVTASQVNRMARSKEITRIEVDTIAEDISKINIADIVCSFHRTDFEKQLGLGRLYVAVSRHTVDGIEVLLGQNYATGQFALTAVEYNKHYENEVKKIVEAMNP